MTEDTTLATRGLKKYFEQQTSLRDRILRRTPDPVRAVDDVNITLHRNESVGIIGESGCGKTTLLKTLMGLHEPTEGDIVFQGTPMSEFDKADWKRYRRNVQIIFQDPFNAINPRMTVRSFLEEPLKLHSISGRDERVRETLESVELRPPERYLDRYPNELSGGELQRVSIARALVVEPEVVLADEPVSMLDVSTQAAILKLLSRLQSEFELSILYISHDLSTVSYICDSINVMYLGRVVERAPTMQLIDEPKHPYSQALMNAIPVPDPHLNRPRTEVQGSPRDPVGLDEGCRFRDRCPEVVQPADYDFEQASWRAVMDVREHIDNGGADLTTLAGVDPDEVDDEALKGAIRQEFRVPRPLSDPAAEAVFDEALAHALAGDQEAARELLATEFASVCERMPRFVEVDGEVQAGESGREHFAACHLYYDDETAVAELQGNVSADGGR